MIESALREQPLRDIEMTEQTIDIRWASPSEFWDWCWSHGWRAVLEGFTPNQLAIYRSGIERSLEHCAEIEGRFVATICTANRL